MSRQRTLYLFFKAIAESQAGDNVVSVFAYLFAESGYVGVYGATRAMSNRFLLMNFQFLPLFLKET